MIQGIQSTRLLTSRLSFSITMLAKNVHCKKNTATTAIPAVIQKDEIAGKSTYHANIVEKKGGNKSAKVQ